MRRPALSRDPPDLYFANCEPDHSYHSRPKQQSAYRVAQADFNIRAGQGRMGVIFRRRPCFLSGGFTRKPPISAELSQAGDLRSAEITG
jgi:hypothetical protein